MALTPTFIIDCHVCKAKVAATEKGRAGTVHQDDNGDPLGERLYLGTCPSCKQLLVGQSFQTGFADVTANEDI